MSCAKKIRTFTRDLKLYELDRLKLTNADDIELETALQEFLLNLRSDAVKTDMASWVYRGLSGVPICHGCHYCEIVPRKVRALLCYLEMGEIIVVGRLQ